MRLYDVHIATQHRTDRLLVDSKTGKQYNDRRRYIYPESGKKKPGNPANQFSSFSAPNFGPPVFFLISVYYFFQRSTGSFDESVAEEVFLDCFDVFQRTKG